LSGPTDIDPIGDRGQRQGRRFAEAIEVVGAHVSREPRWIAAARLVWWRRTPAPPRQQPVSLTVGDRTASARITERTPWGSYSVAGVGAPPFTVEPIELMTLS
jgi:Domain of unknown function (DUF4873)